MRSAERTSRLNSSFHHNALPGTRNERLVHLCLGEIGLDRDFGSAVKQRGLPVSGEKFAGKISSNNFKQDRPRRAIAMPFGTVHGRVDALV